MARGKVGNPINGAYFRLVTGAEGFIFFVENEALGNLVGKRRDGSEVKDHGLTYEVIFTLSGSLKRDSCSSLRLAFSHVSSRRMKR